MPQAPEGAVAIFTSWRKCIPRIPTPWPPQLAPLLLPLLLELEVSRNDNKGLLDTPCQETLGMTRGHPLQITATLRRDFMGR